MTLLPPLIYAVYKGNIEIITLLIEAGANAMIRNFDGETPLHYAFIYNNDDVKDLLLKNSPDTIPLNDIISDPKLLKKIIIPFPNLNDFSHVLYYAVELQKKIFLRRFK